MRITALIVAGLSFAGARLVRSQATAMRIEEQAVVEAPYTPSAEMAPLLAIGYREALADMLYVRLRVYFGGYYGTDAHEIAALGEAIAALDPRFQAVYNYAPNAITIAEKGVDQAAILRSVALLERGAEQFPDDWRLPYLAGQIYVQDLHTDDEAQGRAWRERGTLLIESAIRKPGAPVRTAMWAATLRTRLGQHQRAVDGLRELLLVTPNGPARTRMIEALAKLEDADSTAIAAEVFEMRREFESVWKEERPAVNASMYLLIGPRLRPGFEMASLATGGRDLVVDSSEPEKLEPLE